MSELKILSFLTFMLVFAIFIFSSECIKPTCNKPYILIGNECCLDENENGVCDKDDVTTITTIGTTALGITTTPIILPTTTIAQKLIYKLAYQPKSPPFNAKLVDVSNEGYSTEYMGYKFRIDQLIYAGEYSLVGMLLDVKKPDGTIVQVHLNEFNDGSVDKLRIRLWYIEEKGPKATGSIYVWEVEEIETTTTISILEIPQTQTKLSYKSESPPFSATLLEVDSNSYKAEFRGYKFKLDYLILSDNYEVSNIHLDVQKPNGIVVQVELGEDICTNDFYDAKVDDIVIRLWSAEYAEIDKAKIYVWDFKMGATMKEKPTRELPHPKAKFIEKINSEGYTGEYKNYKFKIDKLIYVRNYLVDGMILDVQKPDMTVVEVEVRKGVSGEVDNLKIFAYFCGEIFEKRAVSTGDIYVWET